jgi:glycosyltransferase involved in cell wall biosynthesis
VVENPIDLEELRRPAARDRGALLHEIGLPADVLVLLNVARLSPQKGLHHAIDALPRIREAHPRAHLLSVGAQDHREWLESLRRRSEELGVAGHVHFLGPRRDIPDWLRACDVFVFPSLFEGLGLALIEAMAAGCVCVASAVGPVTEIVRDGVEGFLVPPGDDAALARAVLQAIDDVPRRRMLSASAKESATRRFDPKAAAHRLEAVYERVLAAPGRV